ncbi:hypothetical protein BOTNAR_0426g00090 [Botryotinia narcissicola]|uniref:Aminotransferase class I/classII large domain-containing protein n=1 Tax=Botryotinia narcissicola TaxID=278944 RepID=A0A4Z1HXS4_9HELO|nr:hypothetical protein BOTNAR_0426g00090 [Botryotinia narcissicola]
MADIIPPISSRMFNIIQALPPAATAAAADNAEPDPDFIDLCHRTRSNCGVGLGGNPSLMKWISKFFNKYFKTAIPITPDHLVTASGAGFCLDALASCICEPGDSILVPGPCWNSVGAYLYCHAGVTMVSAYPSLLSTALTSESLLLALETAYNSSPDPTRIKRLLIFNPHAPFGHANKGLHYISDEVYGCLEFGCDEKAEAFISAILLLDGSMGAKREAMIDRSKVLVLWNPSKLFGPLRIKLSNPMLRVSAIISTYNQTFSLFALLLTHLVNSNVLLSLLNKDNVLLSKTYTLLSSILNYLGIDFLPAIAGFFVFVKLAKDSETRKVEAVVKKFKEFKVMVSPGNQFGCSENEKGWARITNAVPEEEFKEGIMRIWICFGEILSQQNKSVCSPTYLNFKKNTKIKSHSVYFMLYGLSWL